MKSLLLLFFVFLCTATSIQAQKSKSTVTKTNGWNIIEMAAEKATILRKELSLTETQQKEIAKKIYKFTLKATDLLQSPLSNIEKSSGLKALASKQRREIRTILSDRQYYFYSKRDTGITGY